MFGRSRLASDDGITFVEVLTAVILISLGMVGALQAFAGTRATTLGSQRTEVAVHLAQKELETLRRVKFEELELNAAPVPSADPANPNNRVRTSPTLQFRARSGVWENLIVRSGAAPRINQGPQAFTVGRLHMNVYRYVSLRKDSCTDPGSGLPVCGDETKRVGVAVQVDYSGSGISTGSHKPVWVSSVITNPDPGS